MNSANTRAKREISDGQWLAEQETEVVWGWGTPARRLRAQRRANLILAGAAIDASSRVSGNWLRHRFLYREIPGSRTPHLCSRYITRVDCQSAGQRPPPGTSDLL